MTPRVVILSSPSGGGKTTIAQALLARRPDIGYSVSATTRPPRAGENDGRAYHFLTREQFERRRAAGEFLEWAAYAGELYGTLRSEVERVLGSGRHVLMDIEVNGTIQVRRAYPPPQSIAVFILPPSADVLVRRLRERKSESPRALEERLRQAVVEVQQAMSEVAGVPTYDHWIVNDVVEAAVAEVARIVDENGQRKHGVDQVRIGAIIRGLTAEVDRIQGKESE
ncbi:MAG TPA: guanylate kinase [Gemmatimonadales bacterium]